MTEARIAPPSAARQVILFGRFNFTPDPQPGNPEHIHINGNWEGMNVSSVTVSQLPGRHIALHNDLHGQFRALWAAWEAAGLLGRVLSFDGAFAPRYKRKRAFGGVENLSAHSWGAAFDINASLLPMGKPCPAVGVPGCTSELVPLAHQHGFAWGGDFHAPWQDPMHFQAFKILPAA